MLTVGSLFSGVGGFELGFERAGMRTIWFCETDEYASAVLRKNFPNVPNLGDVRKVARRLYDCEPEDDSGFAMCPRCGVDFGDCDCIGTDQLIDEHGAPDVICGGFPCTDISNAGRRAGIDGEHSGLWTEFARIVGELRPQFVVVENVPALLGRGFSRVLGDLAALGLDAQWHCIPACTLGAPHRRDRVWIIGYDFDAIRRSADVADADAVVSERVARVVDGATRTRESEGTQQQRVRSAAGYGGAHVADADSGRFTDERLAQHADEQSASRHQSHGCSTGRRGNGAAALDADAFSERLERLIARWTTSGATDRPGDGSDPGWWAVEPRLDRVAHGVPNRVDRLRCLGNAIVPQVAEAIGRAIVDAVNGDDSQ
jgi:DNA (cytosine-5)-methyltransferase 1